MEQEKVTSSLSATSHKRLSGRLSIRLDSADSDDAFWVDWGELDFNDNKVLGSGGFGMVKLAKHKAWGTVAVKQTLCKR